IRLQIGRSRLANAPLRGRPMVQCTLAGARTNHIVSTISYKPEGQRAPAPKHQPTEGGGRAVGLAGEIAPAERQNPSATERLAVLQHQLAEAADVAQARADAKPAPLQTTLGLEQPVPIGLHAGRPPDRLGAVVG